MHRPGLEETAGKGSGKEAGSPKRGFDGGTGCRISPTPREPHHARIMDGAVWGLVIQFPPLFIGIIAKLDPIWKSTIVYQA